MKELWCFTGNRISVRFEYESHDASGQWWRGHLYHQIATKLRVTATPGRAPEAELA
jgi:nuclear transport factor 2 (NTF2) superfamily protein